MAYRLLNSRNRTREAGKRSERSKHKGIARMDFGVVLIIANSLLAVFIYFILNWLWQD
ncbi:MAG TPA: hypothetical protein VEI50_01995 [Nitrospiraceae bacterium]|nr:hypothetical protein [Nitrospiraceae bacterium]